MRRVLAPLLLVIAAGCPTTSSESEEPGGFFTVDERKAILRFSPRPAVPPDPTNAVADDPRAAHLGQFLFFEPRLSSNGQVACASCHDPAQGFGDGRALSVGVGTTGRHAPTVINTAFNRWYFWDGRADSSWAQALGPLESPVEHGGSRLQYAHLVHDDAALQAAYEAIFGPLPELSDANRFPAAGRPVPDDETHPHHVAWAAMTTEDQDAVTRVFVNLGKSIAAYERKIISTDSRMDRFVRGLREDNAELQAVFTEQEKRGIKLFAGKAQCAACHSGPNLTDLEFHNLAMAPAPGAPEDLGRDSGITLVRASPFNALGAYSDATTGPAADRITFLARNEDALGSFKTPGLRDVTHSAPYMHDGRFATLRDVLTFYSELPDPQGPGHREHTLVRLDLSDDELDDLEAFLRTLDGEPLPASLLAAPASPSP